MPWGRWWRSWRKVGRWPGFRHFSHLPPWKRSGWLFGRGACWAYFWHKAPLPRYWRIPSLSKSEELEEYKKELEDEK